MKANNLNNPLINRSISQLTNSHLLVNCETSLQNQLINSFQAFDLKYGTDSTAVIKEIEKNGKYLTNGSFFFKYNAKLSFMKKFRSKYEDVLKLEEFYKTFNPKRTMFLTLTKKTFPMDELIVIEKKGKSIVKFPQIERSENNLRQFLGRLERYGVIIEKYILVVEIKEENGMLNYHYHMILEFWADITKIRSNRNPKYRDLVYNSELKRDMESLWLKRDTLSEIWKDVTKDGSFVLKPELIRKSKGVFHYILSYINKGLQFNSVESVPYLYYALKSKKAYRIKGLKEMPKVKFELLDKKGNKIEFPYWKIKFVEEDEINIPFQEYKLNVYRGFKNKDKSRFNQNKYNFALIEQKTIKQDFKPNSNKEDDGNQLLSNFEDALYKNRLVFKKRFNWVEVEAQFTQEQLTKWKREGFIFENNEGYFLNF